MNSTVPGHLGVIDNHDQALAIAEQIGYPVMIKASAGGGGKGMRIAFSKGEVAENFARARSEAKSSFGDDRIFLEKYIEQPRHIEIQVLGDQHGNIVYLGERECSIQRRHQKVIEEAPSPFLDAKTRAAMGEEAVALAKAVGYFSAGTVEFIVDARRNFYFLEMNTRLQVEHPVTEMVTGLDLVELMIRVAAGEKLPFGQGDIRHEGWAIEARVYAEDPTRGFLPSIGRLVRYDPPAGEGVRVDAGVSEGAEITLFYDPMIAKLATHGADRNQATDRMKAALDGFYVGGLRHNIPFLAAIIGKERFRAGRLSTDFIADEFPGGFAPPTEFAEADEVILLAAALADGGAGERVVLLDGAPHRLTLPVAAETDWRPGRNLMRLRLGDRTETVQIEPLPARAWRLAHGGVVRRAQVLTPRAAELLLTMPPKKPADTSRLVLSPMPGLLTSVVVSEGQDVKAGEPLAVVEAMKMENVLRAERDGRIAKLCAQSGDSLSVDQVILEFE